MYRFAPTWEWEHYERILFKLFWRSEVCMTCWLCELSSTDWSFCWAWFWMSVLSWSFRPISMLSDLISCLIWCHCISPIWWFTHLWFIADLRQTALLWLYAWLQYTVCVSVCVHAESCLVAGCRRGIFSSCTQEGGPFVGRLWWQSSRPRLVLLSDPRNRSNI